MQMKGASAPSVRAFSGTLAPKPNPTRKIGFSLGTILISVLGLSGELNGPISVMALRGLQDDGDSSACSSAGSTGSWYCVASSPSHSIIS